MTVSESFRKTTWKGKITRDAVKGMNASRQEQSRLQAKIDELENQDAKTYQALLNAHNSKTLNFGIVLVGRQSVDRAEIQRSDQY